MILFRRIGWNIIIFEAKYIALYNFLNQIILLWRSTHRVSHIIRVFFRFWGTYSLIHSINIRVIFYESWKNIITEETVPIQFLIDTILHKPPIAKLKE